MALTALRGAVGFLTRLPVGADADAWESFRATPAAFPLAGYLVGGLLAAPVAVGVALDLPAATVALATLAWLVALTGVAHLDGVADLGDAAAVHGGPEDRAAVLKDTGVGVGAVVGVALAVVGVATGVAALAGLPLAVAVAGVVAAEVGAKAAMAGVVCLGEARHEGLGSQFTERADARDLVVVAAVAAPVVLLVPPVGAAALAAAVLAGGALARWADGLLAGVNGDVVGAANDAGRVAGLHAAAVAWTLLGPRGVVAWTPF